jgi:prepilin signal peptidase PulO-like enzyme (type II secretory pathway)
VNAIEAIPFTIRVAILFAIGTVVGAQLNRAIHQLLCIPRLIGPWCNAPEQAPARRLTDFLPVVGWFALRRESRFHGAGYWIRPLLIELGMGIGFALLYWLEIKQRILYPAAMAGAVGSNVLHAQYLSHIILASLMVTATFTDFLERFIPDEITYPGVIAGLVLAAALPTSLLPTTFEPALGATSLHHLVLTSSSFHEIWQDGLGGPYSWPATLDSVDGLWVALICIWSFCFVIQYKTWTLRHGLAKAIGYLLASILRRRRWVGTLIVGVVATALAVLTWKLGGDRWQALLSSLLGMAFGAYLIWAVRIVAGHALGKEAMGLGDVTLMAMIGAFVGWQSTFLIFFMAPFSALVIALGQWLATRDHYIAFGPYLCLSTLVLLVGWDAIWHGWAMPMFELGWFIPAMAACCLVMMGGLLWTWRIIREWLIGAE